MIVEFSYISTLELENRHARAATAAMSLRAATRSNYTVKYADALREPGSYVAAAFSFACNSHVRLRLARRRYRATRLCIALLYSGIAHLCMRSPESEQIWSGQNNVRQCIALHG